MNPAPLSTSRKWLFGIVAFVILPLLLLAGLELALRLVGCGYRTAYFQKLRVGGEICLIENGRFGLRFFPPDLAGSPSPIVMKARKPPGACRIFILGESAALGDPRPAYGAGRYLEVLLRERFPNARFEVINTGQTAINSHAILPIARECARHEGDIWIVYMGNNEMVGPFGATTVLGSHAPPLGYVRFSLAVQRTRIGQLLLGLGRKLTSAPARAPSREGMKLFLENRIPPDDPRKGIVYENFRRNLEDILRAGSQSGARIVLNTIAVNLKDCPPFAWMMPPTNQPGNAVSLLAKGIAAQAQGDFAGAAQDFEEAARLDPQNAELQFRLGNCRLRLTNSAAARACLEKARDLDALPFRADSRINAIITHAAQSGGPSLALCDAAALFATNQPAGIPGQEVFYEHVHFNFAGNYHLARAWAEQVVHLLPGGITNGAAGGWLPQETCERQLGLTDWNRAAILEDMVRRLSQPPFTNQINCVERLDSFRAQLQEVRQRMDTTATAQARTMYLEAIRRAPNDHWLHENYAEFLEATGDLPGTVAEWRRVHELIPQHYFACLQLGRLLSKQGKPDEALRQFQEALRLDPGNKQARAGIEQARDSGSKPH